MSDRQKTIEETKKHISSLLVCLGAARGKPGIPIRQFHNDYRSLIGSGIPYRELGYSALEDFFRDIPDTVHMQWDGSECLIKLVENESISHIVKLVDNQKTTVSKTRAKQRGKRQYGDGPAGGWQPRSRQRGLLGTPSYQRGFMKQPTYNPPRMRSRDNVYNRPNLNFKSQSNPPVRQLPQSSQTPRNQNSALKEPSDIKLPPRGPASSESSVPPLTRGMIKELLLSFPNGLLGADIDNAFSKRFGQSLSPNKMGFKNIYALFSSIKDIVDIEELDNDFRISQKRLERVALRAKPSGISPGPNGDGVQSALRSQRSRERRIEDYLNEQMEEEGPSRTLRIDVLKVLDEIPSGVWAAQFPKYFENKIGVALPYKDLGYQSVIELMGELNKDVVIIRESKKDWRLYSVKHAPANKPPGPKGDGSSDTNSLGAGSDKVSRMTEELRPNSCQSMISDDIKQAVREVVVCHPEGLPLYELPETFKNMVGKDLPIKDLGFRDVATFVHQLYMDSVVDTVYQGEGLVLLKVAASENIEKSHLLNRRGLGKRSWKKRNKPVPSVPSDALGQGVRYPELKSPEAEDSYFAVFVSMVNDPGQFWIQIRGSTTTEALENLMDELEFVYDEPDSLKYRVPDSMITEGQLCVAKYPNDDNWHRVTLMGPDLNGFVEAYFVDYGTFCSVHKDTLRLLKKRFLHLPAQAIQARLSAIKPFGNTSTWSPRATQRMLDLTSNHAVQCAVMSIDENKVLSVFLCDTSGKEDIHIQDVLVDEQLADVDMGDVVPQDEEQPAEDSELLLASTEPVPESELSDAAGQTPAINPDNVAYVSPMKRGGESWDNGEFSDVPIPNNVRFVELTSEFSIHLVKFEDAPYVLSGEISAFFWDKDLLRSMLRQRRIEIPRKVLPLEDHADLFDEFEFHRIPGVLDNNSQKRTHLTMYPLKSVLFILDAFGNTNEEIRQAIEREINAFDPEDGYWRGEEEDEELRSCSDITGDDDSYTFNMTELKKALEVLQIRRKLLVKSMVDETGTKETQNSVEALQLLEQDIAGIRQRMKDTEKLGRGSEASTEEEFIMHCVEEQNKGPPGVPKARAQAQNEAQVAAPPSLPVPHSVNPIPMVPNVNMTPNPLLPNTQPNLSQDQQRFLMQYNMMLSQQLMQSQAMMGAVQPGMPSFPVMPGMNPAMPNFNPLLNMQEGMANLSISDMSALLLGQGRGAPVRQPFQGPPRPGGFYQGP